MKNTIILLSFGFLISVGFNIRNYNTINELRSRPGYPFIVSTDPNVWFKPTAEEALSVAPNESFLYGPSGLLMKTNKTNFYYRTKIWK